MRAFFLLVVFVLGSTFPALGFSEVKPYQPPKGAQSFDPEAADESGYDVAVTLSPLHFVIPMGELTVELRATDSVGVAVVVGLGTAEVLTFGTGWTLQIERVLVWELGVQARFYPVGDFDHGMQVGVEAMYVGVGGGELDSELFANGLGIGPFLGYKLATSFLLTFEVQGGAQLVVASGSGDSAVGVLPLLNLNVGFSF